MPITLAEFVNRWKINALSERSGSQSHFIDLCAILGEEHPAASDAIGERYTFEKPVSKVYGGKGFADVWLRDHFAWEYKGKHKDLRAAYKQINDYREELGNPPLLVVCDMNRFEVHTNFTNTNPRVYSFSLDDILRNVVTATCPLPPLQVLRALLGDYNVLRPDRTNAFVTQEAAKKFASSPSALRSRTGPRLIRRQLPRSRSPTSSSASSSASSPTPSASFPTGSSADSSRSTASTPGASSRNFRSSSLP